jgi:hypothetical protein
MSYQYWDEYKTGKPYSYAQNKRAERELELGRQVTIAYKGIPVHINSFEEKHIEEQYQEIIKNQNKMKTSKIKSIQNNGTWKELFKFEVEMENGDVGGCFAASQDPPFKVGDEKQYEYTQNGRYWNIKFAKEQRPAWNGGGGAKSFVKEDKSADIARAVALKAAVDLHKGEGEPMNQQIGVICATAQAFEIYLTSGENPYKDAIQDGKSNNADDLPF